MSQASSGADIYKRLLGYAWPFAPFLLASFGGFAIYAASQVGLAELLRFTIDTVRAFSDGEGISRERILIPLGMVAAVAVRGVGTFLGGYCMTRVSSGLADRLRTELFEGLLVLPVAWVENNTRGSLISRLTYTSAQATGAASQAIAVLLREGLTVAALLGWMLWINWRLTLLFCFVAPLIVVIVMFASRRFRRIAHRVQTAIGIVTQLASEAVIGHREIRIYGGEVAERTRFATASAYAMRQDMRMAMTQVLFTPSIQVLVSVALAALIWLTLDPVFLTGMSGGAIVGFITAAGLLARPIRQLSQINVVIQRGIAAAEEMFAQFDTTAEEETGAYAPERVTGAVTFENVSFAYEGGPLVLTDINLQVPAGRTLGLVGRSGGGKSTLASLLLRFQDPDLGRICLDGRPLADYTRAALRRQIAYVGQDTVLFNDTVERNIAYGALAQATPEAIQEAARRAQALEFIDALPDGMQTRLGAGGVGLSGGQRQRLAIARALLKNAPLLVLDEATSALDAHAEEQVKTALGEVMANCTTIIIAHRFSMVHDADEILLLDSGRVVERGRHAALLAANGAYAALHQSQTLARARMPASTVARAAPVLPKRQPGLEQPLLKHWYSSSRLSILLAPLGAITAQVARWRHQRAVSTGTSWRAPVPVLVVGNLTVGGTGKTPFVIWLARWLAARHWHPGIIARGYGAQAGSWPRRVEAGSSAAATGDEALLLYRDSNCPVYVAPQRVLAARTLLSAHPEVDVLLSDDGLQHHALGRDLEILLLDGIRGLGNGRCLPAGPLRESARRLDSVDLLVSNGPLRMPECARPHQRFDLEPTHIHRLIDNTPKTSAALAAAGPVHAVAGIGHPERFFAMLRALDLQVIPHPLDDHAPLSPEMLEFGDEAPIIMTGKDAVRIESWLSNPAYADLASRCYMLKVEVRPTAALEQALTELITPLPAAPVAANQ